MKGNVNQTLLIWISLVKGTFLCSFHIFIQKFVLVLISLYIYFNFYQKHLFFSLVLLFFFVGKKLNFIDKEWNEMWIKLHRFEFLWLRGHSSVLFIFLFRSLCLCTIYIFLYLFYFLPKTFMPFILVVHTCMQAFWLSLHVMIILSTNLLTYLTQANCLLF